MKVLMATDGSPDATLALTACCRLLRKDRVEASVLCVAPDLPRRRRGSARREDYLRRITEQTVRILGEAREVAEGEGWVVDTLTRVGSPAEEILKLAADADLLVTGAKGRNVRADVGLGPVASQLAARFPSALLIARQVPAEAYPRILVAVDGSAAGSRSLELLQEGFVLEQSEIALLHVVETPWVHLGLDSDWFDYPDPVVETTEPAIHMDQELRREAESIIEDARQQLEQSGAAIESIITEGVPGDEILSEAERGNHDLVVLGSSAADDFKHQMLGSVAMKVAWQARCSVLIVR